MRFLLPALAALAVTMPVAAFSADLPKPKAEHVVLCIWDGMRPDFITPENAPNLHALATRGTFFANNHSFYVTTTEVNGTVLATGAFPSRSTVVANREYRPQINPRGPVATEEIETLRKGDELTGGKYLGAPTVAEIVTSHGKRAVVAGTKPVALLHQRNPKDEKSPTIFAGRALPESVLGPIVEALGAFPKYAPKREAPEPNIPGNAWTTHALIDHLWKDGVPQYSVLWMSDPDFPQHVTQPGSATALAGIKGSDTHLGMVVAELQKRGLLDKTDIFVVSDHGFSTIERTADPVSFLEPSGVRLQRSFNSPPNPGDALLVNTGASTGIYVTGHERTATAKIVSQLQKADFAGPIFTREALPGTFPLHDVHLDSPESPDIVYSYRWSDGKSANGTPGVLVAEGPAGPASGKAIGLGTHGSFSRFDVRNTLVAGGPDIRAGYKNENPTGNIDVAPTLLHLLGFSEDAAKCDGRVLTEALAGTDLPTEKPVTKRLEATNGQGWTQYLKTSTFLGKTYFDEGNAVTP